MFKYFKYFEKDNIADGATYDDTWYPDTDIKIHRIYLARKDGASFTKSTFYLKVKETVYTHPVVPAIVLGPDVLTTPILDIPVAAKQVIAFSLKNLENATIDVTVTLECHEP
ncbi:MAG: hypothetical protein QXH20_02545 [Candidatus Bathyarchaeia archaeon]